MKLRWFLLKTPATSQRTVCPVVIPVVLPAKSIVDAEPTNVPLLFETTAEKLLTPVVLSPSIWSALPSMIATLIPFAMAISVATVTVSRVFS